MSSANLKPAGKPIEAVCNFCLRCGAENENVGTIPFRCAACQFSYFFGPVAAVAALIVNEENEVLLVRRARDPGKGCWGLPGGFVDRDESAEQALAREILEETSLEMKSCQLMMTHPNQYNYHGVISPVIDLFYTCQVANRVSIKLASEELDHHEWVQPTATQLDNMAFASNRLALERWMKSK